MMSESVCASRLKRQRGLQYIHAYDDRKVIAGQGTIAAGDAGVAAGSDVLVVPIAAAD